MKKWLFLVVLLGLAVSTAQAELSSWLLSDNEVIGARLGYVKDNIEVGGLSYWWYDSDDPPQVFGAYGVYHFTDAIDVNNPLPLPFLPERLKGTPYIGMQLGVNCDRDKRDFIGPFGGVVLFGMFPIECQYKVFTGALGEQLDDEFTVMMGIRRQF